MGHGLNYHGELLVISRLGHRTQLRDDFFFGDHVILDRWRPWLWTVQRQVRGWWLRIRDSVAAFLRCKFLYPKTSSTTKKDRKYKTLLKSWERLGKYFSILLGVAVPPVASNHFVPRTDLWRAEGPKLVGLWLFVFFLCVGWLQAVDSYICEWF